MLQTVAAILLLWSIPTAAILLALLYNELRRLSAARNIVKEAERILAEDRD